MLKNKSIIALSTLMITSFCSPLSAGWGDVTFKIGLQIDAQNNQNVFFHVSNLPPNIAFAGIRKSKSDSLITRIVVPYFIRAIYNAKGNRIDLYRYPFNIFWKKIASIEIPDRLAPDMDAIAYFVSHPEEKGNRNVSFFIPLKPIQKK